MENTPNLFELIHKYNTNPKVQSCIEYNVQLKLLEATLKSKSYKSFDDLIFLINKKISTFIEEDQFDKADDLVCTCNDVIDNYTDYVMDLISFP